MNESDDVEVFSNRPSGSRVPDTRMPGLDHFFDQSFQSAFGEPFDPFMIFGKRYCFLKCSVTLTTFSNIIILVCPYRIDSYILTSFRSKKWYEGPNVCVERKVIQDGDEIEGK